MRMLASHVSALLVVTGAMGYVFRLCWIDQQADMRRMRERYQQTDDVARNGK